MNRRNLLKIAAGASATIATAARGGEAQSEPTQQPRGSLIQCRDGTTLFYKDWGKGKPMLFVHSAGPNSDMWAYQMIPLAGQGFRCVAYDRRGHGRSSDPGRGYDYDTLADDLRTVIESLELRDVTLVGHSMGCGEIVRYVTRHGSGRVARIALLAPTLPFLLKTPDNPEGFDRTVFQSLRAAWMRDYPKWLADASKKFFVAETSAELQQWGINMALKTSMHAAVECNVAVSETDFRDELTRIKQPTLIIHGTADASAPPALTAQRTARLIPDAQLRIYEGAPHGLFVTHKERLNDDLLRFTQA